MHKKFFAVLILIFVAAGLAACSEKALTEKSVLIKRGDTEIASLVAEVADNEAKRQQGLMYREELAEGRGMLFIFDTPRVTSFWMKNTSIPLSIAYINADNIITSIKDLQPFDLTPVPSDSAVLYALEVPQGWFNSAGVQIGDSIHFA